MLSTIFVLSIIISAAISDLDSTWSLEDDPLFLNTELPSVNSDQSLVPVHSNAPLFNSAQTFGDAVSSTSNDIDTSDESLWDLSSSIISPPIWTGNNNNVNDESKFFDDGDDSFQLADCSTSEFLVPAFDISKRRLRQRDVGDGQKCTNPATTTSPTNSQSSRSSLGPIPDLHDFFENILNERLSKGEEISSPQDPNQNSLCALVTEGSLPWGVCASGLASEIAQSRIRFNFGPAKESFIMWQLYGAALGTFLFGYFTRLRMNLSHT